MGDTAGGRRGKPLWRRSRGDGIGCEPKLRMSDPLCVVPAYRPRPDGPRFVKHVDADFLDQVTELYRQRIPDGGTVLVGVSCSRYIEDLRVSGWVGAGV